MVRRTSGDVREQEAAQAARGGDCRGVFLLKT